MKRFLKHYFNRLLPNTLRSWFKRRLAAKFSPSIKANLTLEESDGFLRCTVDQAWSFLAPLDCKDDLVHFTRTRDGRAEFYGIACAATNGGVLFDIGAASGLISALFCAGNPRNKVFSFEPSPILCARLSAIHQLNQFGDRMQIEPIGIGEATKTAEMLLDPSGGYIQTQRFDHTMWASPKAVQIRLERISDAASRLNIIPQFIKLDIESYEYEAIKASIDFLSRHRPTIFLELHLDYLDQRHLSPRVVVEMLGQCGYGFYTSAGSKLKARELYDSPLQNVHVIAR